MVTDLMRFQLRPPCRVILTSMSSKALRGGLHLSIKIGSSIPLPSPASTCTSNCFAANLIDHTITQSLFEEVGAQIFVFQVLLAQHGASGVPELFTMEVPKGYKSKTLTFKSTKEGEIKLDVAYPEVRTQLPAVVVLHYHGGFLVGNLLQICNLSTDQWSDT